MTMYICRGFRALQPLVFEKFWNIVEEVGYQKEGLAITRELDTSTSVGSSLLRMQRRGHLKSPWTPEESIHINDNISWPPLPTGWNLESAGQRRRYQVLHCWCEQRKSLKCLSGWPGTEDIRPTCAELSETQVASSSLVHLTASGDVSIQHPDRGV